MTKFNTWWHNKKINPETKRKIKKGGKVFKNLLSECLINNHIQDNYSEFRNRKKDPLLFLKLPTIPNKPIFEYKVCWEPLTGEIIGKDPRGSLYFDPDSLIFYFYTNRLRYLWDNGDNNFSGNYGDAVGNGPYFNIPGRGYSPHYYLFRLPLSDAFCYKISKQQITVGPILTRDEIKKLDKLSKSYADNFKKNFGIDRPNIIELYDLYHEAINNQEIDDSIKDNLFFSEDEIRESKYLLNKLAVDKLKSLK